MKFEPLHICHYPYKKLVNFFATISVSHGMDFDLVFILTPSISARSNLLTPSPTHTAVKQYVDINKVNFLDVAKLEKMKILFIIRVRLLFAMTNYINLSV